VRNSQGTEEDATGTLPGDADHLSTSDRDSGGFLGRQIENVKTFVFTAFQNLISQNVSICHALFFEIYFLLNYGNLA